MNARERLAAMIRTDRGSMTVWDPTQAREALDAYRAEILREEMRNLRRVEREETPEGALGTRTGLLRAALILDERAEQAGEKATGPVEVSASDFFEPGHTYAYRDSTDWRFRCDVVTTHPEDGERTALGRRRFQGVWSEYAYGEDDWGVHQTLGVVDVTGAGA